MKTTAQYIRYLRIQKGDSLKCVGKCLNMSASALHRIETGITDPNLSRLMQIADFYGITLVELLNQGESVCGNAFEQLRVHQVKLDRTERWITELHEKIIVLYEELAASRRLE